ncbi:hypothetical protein ACFSKI_01925 [Pseudogracilibacillus auburnensis]|uniref:ABC-2 type transport system permease protein n=1 Tax=Pseudogracilibacillus auburnensis TaxID=1494959 RepID=A0A2V3W4G5_9BACI|nr:hypothetical protein [Pseudogracilibacillus auburnensis]PXW87135.1 hypothetical protein DFR56_106205 [Pseudogracilibacillus auburnensis]
MIGLLLLFFFFLFLGIGVGLFVKTVGMMTAYLMPILFLFGFTPMIEFLNLEQGRVMLKITNMFPVPQLIQMADTGSWTSIGIVFIWFIGSVLFAYICFMRTRKDV